MEQKNKSKLDQLRDWWEMVQIKRRRHQSIWYLSYFAFALCCYTIMFTFGLFVESGNDLISSKVGQSLQIGSTNYELVEKKLDRKKNEALIVVANPEGSIADLSKELKVSVEFLESSGEKVKVHLLEGDKGYYVIQLENLPQQWLALRLTLSEVSEENTTNARIVLSNKQEKSTTIHLLNKDQVLIDSFNYQIVGKEKLIKGYRKDIEKNDRSILNQQDKIRKIKDEMKYQTDSEQKQSEGSIEQIQSNITQIQTTNKAIEKDILELNEQIKKVEQRIHDEK